MRTLTGTLEAAQREGTQRPRVRLLIRDRQARFKSIGSESHAQVQPALCVGVDGVTIIIVALDTSGVIKVRLVSDPASMVGWGSWDGDWTQICDDALGFGNGDVAISLNGSTVRMFYIKADGTRILCRESTDDGVNWGSASTVKIVAGGMLNWEYRLATAGRDDIFWTYNRIGYQAIRFRKKNGGWASEQYLWALYGGGTERGFASCGGLSVSYNSSGGYYELAGSFWNTSLEKGFIATAKFTDGSGLSGRQAIVPPGLATPGFTPLWPVLYRVPTLLGGGWLLTYTDKFTSSTLSWSNPVCLRSRDFEHWSYKIPLGFDTSYEKRLCCTAQKVEREIYLYAVNEAYQLDLWSSGESSMEMTEGSDRVLRYRMHERPGTGSLLVELDNRDGRYDDPGSDGATAEAMKPLARVIVEQGLKTAGGDERVECRPFYLWSVSQVREPRSNWTRIHAVDGWQLFKLWRPDATYVFQGQTLGWCIEELASRVGYFECAFDASAEWNMVLSYMAVTGEASDWLGRHHIRAWGRWVRLDDITVAFDSRMNGYQVLQQLLGLVGGMARWGNGTGNEHVLYCFIPYKQGEDPAADHSYDDGEIRAGQYVKAIGWPTRVRASGDSVAYEGKDNDNALAVGMEFIHFLYQETWNTAAECQIAVNSALDDADARVWGGWIRTRPNVGLELFDVIEFSDSKAGGGLATVKRRVNGLLTLYEPLERKWEQTVYVEGV